jgi:hypothetical protein
MKKIIYALVAIAFSVLPVFTNAQCTVSNHTQPGFYPSPQEGIHPAAATDYYALNVTIRVPADTTIPPFGTLAIDSMTVREFIGFPSSFQFYYNTPSQWIKGANAGCMLIHGTPGVADIGTHNISLVFSVMIFGFVYTDTIDNYWQFEVKDAGHIGVADADNASGHIAVYPNPANHAVEFVAPVTSDYSVSIFDLSGKMVLNLEENLIVGEKCLLNIKALHPGIYLVRIENESGHTVRKLSVVR